ncbi:MAG TPA: YdcF family protein [Ktedonobacteraceae bacterium]|nr:YdcF family protein [Ktedonobacteraceae bacterium]
MWMIVAFVSFLLVMIAVGILWIALVLYGKRFALREKLQKADAIVVLAGTRGNIKFLQGKIATAVRLYQQGWASTIICTGKFSVKVTETPTLIPVEALRDAVTAGRIQEKDISPAAKSWDTGLGAGYMQDQAISMGVPPQAVLVEQEALHTRENAEYVLRLLKQHQMRRIILVTSPFHQQRTYLTFAKVFQLHDIQISNYYAEADEWHPLTWFFSSEHRRLVRSEKERIKVYRAKGDLI